MELNLLVWLATYWWCNSVNYRNRKCCHVATDEIFLIFFGYNLVSFFGESELSVSFACLRIAYISIIDTLTYLTIRFLIHSARLRKFEKFTQIRQLILLCMLNELTLTMIPLSLRHVQSASLTHAFVSRQYWFGRH